MGGIAGDLDRMRMSHWMDEAEERKCAVYGEGADRLALFLGARQVSFALFVSLYETAGQNCETHGATKIQRALPVFTVARYLISLFCMHF